MRVCRCAGPHNAYAGLHFPHQISNVLHVDASPLSRALATAASSVTVRARPQRGGLSTPSGLGIAARTAGLSAAASDAAFRENVCSQLRTIQETQAHHTGLLNQNLENTRIISDRMAHLDTERERQERIDQRFMALLAAGHSAASALETAQAAIDVDNGTAASTTDDGTAAMVTAAAREAAQLVADQSETQQAALVTRFTRAVEQVMVPLTRGPSGHTRRPVHTTFSHRPSRPKTARRPPPAAPSAHARPAAGGAGPRGTDAHTARLAAARNKNNGPPPLPPRPQRQPPTVRPASARPTVAAQRLRTVWAARRRWQHRGARCPTPLRTSSTLFRTGQRCHRPNMAAPRSATSNQPASKVC